MVPFWAGLMPAFFGFCVVGFPKTAFTNRC